MFPPELWAAFTDARQPKGPFAILSVRNARFAENIGWIKKNYTLLCYGNQGIFTWKPRTWSERQLIWLAISENCIFVAVTVFEICHFKQRSLRVRKKAPERAVSLCGGPSPDFAPV